MPEQPKAMPSPSRASANMCRIILPRISNPLGREPLLVA
jgi:hypothetical protein